MNWDPTVLEDQKANINSYKVEDKELNKESSKNTNKKEEGGTAENLQTGLQGLAESQGKYKIQGQGYSKGPDSAICKEKEHGRFRLFSRYIHAART